MCPPGVMLFKLILPMPMLYIFAFRKTIFSWHVSQVKSNGTFQLWGHTIQVDWADPEKEVDEETMQRVKVLYVRNLMISTTEETIKAEFNKFKVGAVERVKKLRDYAFVHFFNREDAVSAMSIMNGKCIDGASIEVTLAKPVNKEGTWRQHLNGQFSPNSESLLAFANKEDLNQKPLSRSPNLTTRLNGQHSPVSCEYERCTYPIYPGTKLTLINMYSLKSNHFHSAVMHLDYYCNKNNWTPPEYYLYSTTSQDGKILLVFKVVVPSIANGTHSYFMPDKLCTTLEDAKELAAQFTLIHLGIDNIMTLPRVGDRNNVSSAERGKMDLDFTIYKPSWDE